MFGQLPLIKAMATDPDRGAIYQQATTAQRAAQLAPTPAGDQLLPGASMLPIAIARRLTVRNGVIGATAVVASYLLYVFLRPRKKAAATVSGFWKRRRR